MFQKTRIKLTAWYLLIIMLISVFFSFVIYKVLTHEFERFAQRQKFRIEQRFQNPPPPFPVPDPDLIKEVKQRLLLSLTGINLIILVLSGGLGYFLAGKTLKPIKDMVDEQNRFISDASHELRTPLTALKTSMEVGLRNKKLALNEAKLIISENLNEINRLQLMSEKLLELARNQNLNNKKQFGTYALDRLINEVFKKISPLVKQKQIILIKRLVKCEINCNKDEVINLLVILLDNAIKYSPKKSVINVTVTKTDRCAIISIKDNGIGIDEKNIPLIFDRFYRVDSSRTRNKVEGFGLGLSIGKKIIEDHHGKIKVKSKIKKGSTFIVELPIK